jgi:hypothetical protein
METATDILRIITSSGRVDGTGAVERRPRTSGWPASFGFIEEKTRGVGKMACAAAGRGAFHGADNFSTQAASTRGSSRAIQASDIVLAVRRAGLHPAAIA